MSLDKLEKEILSNAEKECRTLEQETKDRIAQLEEEVHNRVKTRKKQLKARYEQELDRLSHLYKTRQSMGQKRSILTAKRLAIDEIYEAFFDYLQSNKKTVMKQLFDSIKNDSKDATLLVSETDKKLASTLFPKLTIKTTQINGGFILETKNKENIIDCSFETITSLLRKQTLKKTATSLFGGSL